MRIAIQLLLQSAKEKRGIKGRLEVTSDASRPQGSLLPSKFEEISENLTPSGIRVLVHLKLPAITNDHPGNA